MLQMAAARPSSPVVVILIAACLVSFLQASLYKEESKTELHRYQLRNKVLHDLLISEECLGEQQVRERRDILEDGKSATLLEVEKKVYHHLSDQLIACRKRKLEKTKPITKPSPTTTTTPATTITPTTTLPPCKLKTG